MNNLENDMKNPAAQAGVIAALSIIAATGCFYFARWPEGGGEPHDPSPESHDSR
jgi:hypothetical protein